MYIELRERKVEACFGQLTVKPFIHLEIEIPIIGSMCPCPYHYVDTAVSQFVQTHERAAVYALCYDSVYTRLIYSGILYVGDNFLVASGDAFPPG